MLQLIKDEIVNDPMNRLYDSKSDQEIADLLNEPMADESNIVVPARINQIFVGIPFTPNVVTASDISDAKSL